MPLITRRGLIRAGAGAAAALTLDDPAEAARAILALKTGSLGFPGGRPGFDPSHFAASGVRLSAVAQGPNFVNLLNDKKGTPTTIPGSTVDSRIGPGVVISTTAGANNYVSFVSPGQAIPAAATIATIFTYNTNGNFSGLFGSNQTTFGILFGAQAAGGSIQLYNGTVLTSVACVPVAGHAYLVVASYNSASANFGLVDLVSGKISQDTVTGAAPTAAADGTYCIGVNNNFSTNSLVGAQAALMFGANYLSPPLIRQWLLKPWGFWYQGAFDLASSLQAPQGSPPPPGTPPLRTLLGVGQ